MIDEIIWVRGIHILGVVLWIGGVSMVTTILLPAVRRLKSAEEGIELFAKVENRFAWQARVTTLMTGLSGFYMVSVLDLWQRFLSISYWWLHLMVLVWFLFTMVLFVLEPLFLHRWFQNQAKINPVATFRKMQILHWILLTLSLITLFGAVVGSHGYLFFAATS